MTEAIHLPCPGDADDQWLHCGCHHSDCPWDRAIEGLTRERDTLKGGLEAAHMVIARMEERIRGMQP